MVTRLFESRSFKFLKSMEKIYLSLDRYNELKQELAALKKSGREEMAQKLKNAKEFGDLSENFEYQEAKEEQSWLERKIFQLEETLRGAVIIKGGGKEKVGIGSISLIFMPLSLKKTTLPGQLDWSRFFCFIFMGIK